MRWQYLDNGKLMILKIEVFHIETETLYRKNGNFTSKEWKLYVVEMQTFDRRNEIQGL